jgi:hypothetical protein
VTGRSARPNRSSPCARRTGPPALGAPGAYWSRQVGAGYDRVGRQGAGADRPAMPSFSTPSSSRRPRRAGPAVW